MFARKLTKGNKKGKSRPAAVDSEDPSLPPSPLYHRPINHHGDTQKNGRSSGLESDSEYRTRWPSPDSEPESNRVAHRYDETSSPPSQTHFPTPDPTPGTLRLQSEPLTQPVIHRKTYAGAQGSQNTTGNTTGLSSYMRTRKDLLDVLKKLHATGIQNELGDLPQIVVIGSQSVGKSSLIESMSGLSLPRDDGTCTRCPMECHLQSGTAWTCDIVLRFTVDPEGHPLREVRKVIFGETLRDKAEVQNMLRRAQRAILRPTVDPKQFLTDADNDIQGHPPQSFSANCVCVEVKGPNVPDLYFYDLPGLIANVADDGDPRDIDLIDKLAETYTKRPSCIVLLVIACDTDFENQKAGRLIMQDSALKDRTIGVLTKVDRIDAGGASRWLRIVQGQSNILSRGWFCVKQPDLGQLRDGLSWEDARANEAVFFESQVPWSKQTGPILSRMGSGHLAEFLGSVLSDLVAKELPSIQAKVNRDLVRVNRQLSEIAPQTITTPVQEVNRLFSSFFQDLFEHIHGKPPIINPTKDDSTIQTGLWKALHQNFAAFRRDIFCTAPQFRPWSSTSSSAADRETSLKSLDTAFGLGSVNEMYSDEVLELAQDSRTRELPGNYPFAVQEGLIKQSTVLWHDIARGCFKTHEKVVRTHVNALIEIHFGAYKTGGLCDLILEITGRELTSRSTSTIDEIRHLCEGELVPYTQNEEFYFRHMDRYLQQYRQVHRQSEHQDAFVDALRLHSSNSQNLDNTRRQYINQVISNLAALGAHGLVAVDLTRVLSPDSVDPALKIMAEVRSYFEVAYKRFTDSIPKLIDAVFLRGLHTALDDSLRGLEKDETCCRKWLAEPIAVVRKREALLGKKMRLEAALKQLSAFNNGQSGFVG